MRNWQRFGVGIIALITGTLSLCQLSYASGLKKSFAFTSHDSSLINTGTLLGLNVPVPLSSGGTGQVTRLTAINALLDSSSCTSKNIIVDASNNVTCSSSSSGPFVSPDTSVYLANANLKLIVGGTSPNSNGNASSKVSIIGFANDHQLNIKAFSSQTNDTVRITDSTGNALFRISGDGTIVSTQSGIANATWTLGNTGVIIKDDGDGTVTFIGNSTGSDESLGFNYDDTSNAVVVSTDSGVTFISYDSIGLRPGGAVTPKVVELPDGANPALDASLGNTFRLVAGGDRTIAAPTNTQPFQRFVIIHQASGGARTLSVDSASAGGFRFGTDLVGPLTATSSGKQDYIACVVDPTDNKVDIVSVKKGY